jgi:hypothetical protein
VARFFVLVAVLAALALGCGNSQFRDVTTAYVGIWTIVSGENTDVCPPIPGQTATVSGSVIVGFGAAPLMLSVRDTNHGTCVWQLAVTGASATFRSGAACGTTTPTSNAAILPMDYTLTLTSPNEATATSAFEWSFLGDTCVHTQQESLLLMEGP